MMKTMFRTALGLGMVALLTSAPAAHAQGRGGWGGGGITMVLINSGVQKELKFDDKQVEKAKELADSTREKMMSMREKLADLDQDERRAKMTEMMYEINTSTLKSSGEFLKAEQVTRLKQIFNQVRGAMAFSDPEVSKKLGITDSQKEEIQAINREAQSEMPGREEFQDDYEAASKKRQEVITKTLAKAEEKLNDEQRKSWKEMIGAHFDYKAERPPQQ